jgi:AraC-like DNA-binding protein
LDESSAGPDVSLRLVSAPLAGPVELACDDVFSLGYVLAGGARFHHAGGVLEAGPGDAVFWGPTVPHAIAPDDPGRLAVFRLRPHALQTSAAVFGADSGVFSDYLLRAFYGVAPVRDHVFFPRHEGFADRIRDSVEAIARDLAETGAPWNLLATAELTRVVALLARGYQGPPRADPDTESARLVAAVVHHIREHYRDVTLEKLAAEFNYSPTHLSRLIRRHTGRRFAEVVHDLKLSHAEDYLQNTDLGLEQISERVGFSSASYLVRVFRARSDVTPSRFRSTARQGRE